MKTLLTICLCCLSLLTIAQQRSIIGRVINNTTNLPLPDATVKTATQTVLTDTTGAFSILADVGQEITVSYVGMLSATIKVTPSTSNLDILLTQSSVDQPGININWTQQTAREALRFERRLEFALEGNRFFDLVRWGIAAEYLNAYFKSEAVKRTYLQTANFQKGRDEYLPIPTNQINYSKSLYVQNTNW